MAAKDSQEWLSYFLEGVAQGELDQARRAYRREDFAERAGIFDVVDGRVGEVGVIPDVEEIRGETELLAFGDLKVLDQRKIPILLERAAIDVSSEIAEESYSTVATLGSRNHRGGREVGEIKVTVIHPVMDAAAGVARGDGAARELRS